MSILGYEKKYNLIVEGMPQHPSARVAQRNKNKLIRIVSGILNDARDENIKITVGTEAALRPSQTNKEGETLVEQRARQYEAISPLYHFPQLIVSQDVEDELLRATATIQAGQKVEEWGLPAITSVSYVALHLYGKPGTGKTLAAHALAERLRQNILLVNYTDIHGELIVDGPKNVSAIFYAASRDKALLFIDEADALLFSGASQATSSQIRICMENFSGAIIFATNSIESYNKAFETRVRHIHFPMPDEECRRKLWQANLPEAHLRAADVDPATLATQIEDICGREISQAVRETAGVAAAREKSQLELDDLLEAVKRIKNSRIPQQPQQAEQVQASILTDHHKMFEARVRHRLLPIEQEKVSGTNHHTPSSIEKTEKSADQNA